ncbi:phosphodiester glycosidase family protein [Streptomyces kaempferi]
MTRLQFLSDRVGRSGPTDSAALPRRSRLRSLLPVAVVTAAAGLFTTLLIPPATSASASSRPTLPLSLVQHARTHPDDDAEDGVRAPSGPVVPPQPDDGASATADPRPARSGSDSLQTASDTERIAPGVTLTRQRSVDAAGFLDGYVLRADLDGPTRPRLLAPTVSTRDTPTNLADRANAVAATNGDFFAIDTTNAPIGPEVRDGELIKADARPASVVGLDKNGVGQIADLLLEGSVTVDGVPRDLAGLNPGSVPADAIALYTSDWGSGDRHYAVPAGHVVEIEVRGGKVVAVREGAGAGPVAAGSQLLLATGQVADALAGTTSGTPVQVSYHARSSAPSPYSLALGAHLVLVHGGELAPIDTGEATNSSLKPRTALGWTARRQLVLYVADGSSSRSRGLTAAELAQHMKDLGAVDAVMLDGGGSSQLVARRPGDRAASVTNVPSDGSQRIVPNAVGLVPPAGSGRLRGIDVRLRSDRLFPGLSRDVAAAATTRPWPPRRSVRRAGAPRPGTSRVRTTPGCCAATAPAAARWTRAAAA